MKVGFLNFWVSRVSAEVMWIAELLLSFVFYLATLVMGSGAKPMWFILFETAGLG